MSTDRAAQRGAPPRQQWLIRLLRSCPRERRGNTPSQAHGTDLQLLDERWGTGSEMSKKVWPGTTRDGMCRRRAREHEGRWRIPSRQCERRRGSPGLQLGARCISRAIGDSTWWLAGGGPGRLALWMQWNESMSPLGPDVQPAECSARDQLMAAVAIEIGCGNREECAGAANDRDAVRLREPDAKERRLAALQLSAVVSAVAVEVRDDSQT